MASDFDRRATRNLTFVHPPNPGPIIARQGSVPQTATTAPELLRRLGVAPEAGDAAIARARENGTHLYEELLAESVVSPTAYATVLAEAFGVACLSSAEDLDVIEARTEPGAGLREVVGLRDGHTLHVLDAMSAPPDEIDWHLNQYAARGSQVMLAPRTLVDSLDERAHAAARLDHAIHGLRRRNPDSSAAGPWRWHQIFLPVILVGLVLGGLMVMPERTLTFTALLLGLPFLSVTVLRLIAFREVVVSRHRRSRPHAALPARELPVYSVLVPLYHEAEVLPELVAALTALDYPASKLDIVLLIEATDLAMQSALLVQPLPAHMRIVVVPDSQPRTKPKALNYGLQFARGAMIVVFDAEDRPQPQQLRRAAALFAHGPSRLACVQAQLNIFNPRDGWFAGQFTIEYSTLFDAVLPALERLDLPIPLGGTSNHFRRSELEEVGAWDPFNVTEDADLGIRLARAGRSTRIMPSTTWEEAPTTLAVWLPQRTRWLKGWMQTWLVHTRRPGALKAALGGIGAAGVHAVMGGLVVSALVQPIFLALLAYQVANGALLTTSDSVIETGLLWISWGNLAVGYLVSMTIGVVSVAQRGRFWLAPAALFMPLYWLLISIAAYRALYQLVRSPFLWEKTPHGMGRRRSRR